MDATLPPGKGWWPFLGSLGLFVVMAFAHHQSWLAAGADAQLADHHPGLSVLKGRVTHLREGSGGILSLSLATEGHGNVTLNLMPTLGPLPFSAKVGDRITCTAYATQHTKGGRPTHFRPASALHLALNPPQESTSTPPTLTLQEAQSLPPKRLILLRVQGLKAEPFTSRNGKKHLRFTVADPTGQADGVMWEGSHGDREAQLLAAGSPLLLRAKTARHRRAFSLVGLKVEAAP